MTGDRSRRIRNRVQRLLGDPAGLKTETTNDVVYDVISGVQDRIIEKTLCLETTKDIIVDDELIDFPEDMISERVLMSGTLQLKRINMDEARTLKRNASGSESNDTCSLMYFYKWDNQFGFLLSNGSAPSSETTVSMYYWRRANDEERISNNVDPIVNQRWDRVMIFGAIAEIRGSAKDEMKYESEFSLQLGNEAGAHSESLQIASVRDYD